MGDYESARVDVGLTLPFDGHNYEAAYDEAREWVRERAEEEISLLKADRPTGL
jgi:hypothetical protein